MELSKNHYLEGIPKKKIRHFREKASRYYLQHGRKNLPWRKPQSAWQVLIAEMLLRKTTVTQALPVYEQLKDLAPHEVRDLPLADLETMLQTLGIHRERARLLKLVGERVSDEGVEQLSDRDFLRSLPGVGRYAASMVLSTFFSHREPALDRNMIRVLGRVFSIRSNKSRPHTDRELWKAATEIAPRTGTAEFNWGILDLSAALCRPRNPHCTDCPLETICDYAARLQEDANG